MSRRAATTAGVALLAAGAAEAQPPGNFCRDLRKVVLIAERGGGFVRLERGRAAPPRLGFGECWATRVAPGEETGPRYRNGGPGLRRPGRDSWYCRQDLADLRFSVQDLATLTAACLPDSERLKWSADEAVFTLPYARIRIRELGGSRPWIGRVVSYQIKAVAR